MANLFKGVVKLTEEQYITLKNNGTLTVGDITIDFDENTLYVTDYTIDSVLNINSENPVTNKAISEALTNYVNLNDNQTINGNKNFTGEITKNMIDIATVNDIPLVVDGLNSTSSDSALSANQGKVLNEKINSLLNNINGQVRTFTAPSLSTLLDLFGYRMEEGDTGFESYMVGTSEIVYNGENITLKTGDIFLLVDVNVPDYWFSLEDKSLYQLETRKIDLTNYYTIQETDQKFEEINDSLKNKVDKVEGKQLSTNDYTTIEKNKLDSIEENAQVNVQSDWNATSGDAFIQNKPTKVSQFENDSKFATEEYVNENGGKIDRIFLNNVEQEIVDKEVHLTVELEEMPTNYYKIENKITQVDLNTIVEPGNYGVANDCTNIPIAENGTLFVGLYQNNQYAQQMFISASNNVYVRTSTSIDNSTWNNWIKLSNENDLQKVLNINDIAIANSNIKYAISDSNKEISTNNQFASKTSNSTVRMRGCAYGNGIYAIVGTSGAIQYSIDNAQTWNIISSFTTNVIVSIAYGGGNFICVDSAGGIFKSRDCISWQKLESPITDIINAVVYVNGKFALVGANGLIAFSNDGEIFNVVKSGTTNELTSITRGLDKYVAVSTAGDILTSINGVDWTNNAVDTTHYRTATFGKNMFVIGGQGGKIKYSTDAINWIDATHDSTSTVNYIRDIKYANGKFYAVMYISTGAGEIWTSLDGATWTKTQSTAGRLWCLGYGDDILFASGDNGAIWVLDLDINWLDTQPIITNNQYIWSKETYYLTDGSIVEGEVEVYQEFTDLINQINDKPNINGNNIYTSSNNFYAPVVKGNYGQLLMSNGTDSPSWTNMPDIQGSVTLTSLLPEEYQEVEYLECDGNQYIDTGVISNGEDFKMEGNTYASSSIDKTYNYVFSSEGTIYGLRGNYFYPGSNRDDYGFVITYPISMFEKFLTVYSSDIFDKFINWSFILNKEYINGIKDRLDVLTEQGTEYSAEYTSTNNISNAKIILFKYGDDSSNNFVGKAGKFKIYISGVIQRDFIPCYRKEDNVAGYYDLLNGVFYENLGTNSFVVGPDTPMQTIKQFQFMVQNIYQGSKTLDDTFVPLSRTISGKTLGTNIQLELKDLKNYEWAYDGNLLYKLLEKEYYKTTNILTTPGIGKTMTKGGLDFTRNADGSITINGTSTVADRFYLLDFDDVDDESIVPLDENKTYRFSAHKISGSISGYVSEENYLNDIASSGITLNFDGSYTSGSTIAIGKYFNISSRTEITAIYISFIKDYTYDNFTIGMRLEEVPDTTKTFLYGQGPIVHQKELEESLSLKVNITDITNFITKDVDNLTNYTLSTGVGSKLDLSIDSSTYVMTLSLTNSQGTALDTKTVDLPLETMVVDANYDNSSKEITLTLQNGNTTSFSVADLVSGLVNQSALDTTNTNVTNLTTRVSTNETNITNLQNDKANTSDLSKVATSGLYTDLSGIPSVSDMFSPAQWSTINSGITNIEVEQISNNAINITNLQNNKANTSDLSSYVPLSGATMQGALTFMEGNNIVLGTNTGQIVDSHDNVLFGYTGTANITVGSNLAGYLFLQGLGERITYKDVHNTSSTIAFTSDIPTKTSQLTNDSNFLTSAPVTSVNGQTGEVVIDIPDTSGFVPNTRTVNGKALSSNISLGNKDVGALPDYTLTINHGTAGNPRMVKFASVNYSSAATCFKMGAMTCHDNGVSYQFLTDMLIAVTTAGEVTANIYKFAQSSVGSVDGVERYTGDVFYVNDTTNKIVDFYILCGQYSSSQFTPATKVGSTTINYVTQYSGTATYYSSGTKEWVRGCGETYARTNDIPKLVTLTQAEYDALTTKDANTYYFIKE